MLTSNFLRMLRFEGLNPPVFQILLGRRAQKYLSRPASNFCIGLPSLTNCQTTDNPFVHEFVTGSRAGARVCRGPRRMPTMKKSEKEGERETEKDRDTTIPLHSIPFPVTMPMIVKNVYQLNSSQRRWLYKEMKRRKLMNENQKTADANAASRRRELMQQQIVVHGSRHDARHDNKPRNDAQDQILEDAIIQDNNAFYCCTSLPTWDDNDYDGSGGSLCTAEELQLEDFFHHFINDSTTSSVLEFLALD